MRKSWLAIALLVAACGSSAPAKDTAPKEDSSAELDAGPSMLGTEEKLGELREVEFTTEDDVIIHGTLHPSLVRQSHEQQSDGVVLFVHQLGSTREEWTAFVSLLGQTHSSLSIDLRGHGASVYQSDGTALDQESFTEEDWKKTVLDVRAAVSYLRDLQPAPKSITLVGSSIGSSAALLYAAQDREVDALVMLSPGLAYRGMRLLAEAKKLKNLPVLLVAMSGDRDSAKAARLLSRKVRGSTLQIFKGDGHGVTMSGPVVPEVVEFVKRNPGSQP